MMPKHEIDKAVEIARKRSVGELYLIGSTVHKQPEPKFKDLVLQEAKLIYDRRAA